MTNKFFPEEQISENDLYFLCYMIERGSALRKSFKN